eukprot:ANDGO_07697.mRNA.1 hypothetical protein
MSMHDLQDSVLYHVCTFLTQRDLFVVKEVSSRFRKACLLPALWVSLSFPLESAVEDADHPRSVSAMTPHIPFASAVWMVRFVRPRKVYLHGGLFPPTLQELDELFSILAPLRIETFEISGNTFDDVGVQNALFDGLASVCAETLTEFRMEGVARVYQAAGFVSSVCRLQNLRVLSIPYTGVFREVHVEQILGQLPHLVTFRLAPCGSGSRPLRVMDPVSSIAALLPRIAVENLSICFRSFVLPYKAQDGLEALFRNEAITRLKTVFVDKCPRRFADEVIEVTQHQRLLEGFVKRQASLDSLYLAYRPETGYFDGLSLENGSVSKLSLHTDGDNANLLLMCPRLEKLSLVSARGTVSLQSLNSLRGLKRLSLRYSGLTIEDVAVLLDQEQLSSLEQASFMVENVRQTIIKPMPEAEYLAGVHIQHPNLRVLSLRALRIINVARLVISCPKVSLGPLLAFPLAGQLVVNGTVVRESEEILQTDLHRIHATFAE